MDFPSEGRKIQYSEYSFHESRIIGIGNAIVIAQNIQKITGIVMGDEIP
jgi:hypothetical protein